MKLRYYQQLAVSQFNNHYYTNKNNSGILSMCCGSGKTFTFWSIMVDCIKNHNEKLFMYVTSRRLLVKDIIFNLINWIYINGLKIDIIYKVSDFSILQLEKDLYEYHKDTVYKFKEYFSYYKKHNFINPDDSNIISELKNRLFNNRKVIIITTYESSNKFIDTMSNYNKDNDQINPDLLILDECHHVVSEDRIKKAKNILDQNENKYFFPSKYLFMTATPLKIIKKNNESEYIDGMIEYSMDNIDIYGKIFFEYSFYQGKIDDNITGFEIISLKDKDKVKYNEISKKIKNLNKEDQQTLYFETIGYILNQAIKDNNLKRTIVFLSDQYKINIFKEILNKLKLDCYICHSDQNNTDRNNNINDFKITSDDTKILLSVGMLNEGVDIPICDSILFAEDRKSETIIVQNIGRALRKSPGKQIAYVIIPTYIYNVDVNENNELIELSETNSTNYSIFSSKFKTIRYICDILVY
jgi:superfamily II DNA or RNA helicase